ncbi:MAG: hypothetical protein QG604_971 [Candidatus Dependentiae bacterium]|nr:hypothetical protein [Candidatus Dependentiae bacterium]
METGKKCKVGILYCNQNKVHNVVANQIFELLQAPASESDYLPWLISTKLDEYAFRANVSLLADKEVNLILVFGEFFSVLLCQIYRESREYQTVFIGVTDPVQLGLVQSLEKPGGSMSGVRMEPAPEDIQADVLARCFPYVSKVLIPYCSKALSGRVKLRAESAAERFRSSGICVQLYPIDMPEDAIEVVFKNIDFFDGVLVLEGCSTTAVVREIAAICLQYKKVFCSNNGWHGIEMGATFSYGPNWDETAKQAVKMIRLWWDERQPLATQSVVTLSNNRVFFVNEVSLRQIGDVQALIERLMQIDGVRLVRCWPNTFLSDVL